METIVYGRISTNNQNSERQESEGKKLFIDKCSGTIPFAERPEAKKLLKYCKANEVEVEVLDIDRLGRNLSDILNTIEAFKKDKIEVHIKSLGVSSSSPLFETIIGIFGTVAQLEKNLIKERTKAGIEIAKLQGKYLGRAVGSVQTNEAILEKYKDVVEALKTNKNISKVAFITKRNRATVYKVLKAIESKKPSNEKRNSHEDFKDLFN
jgi:DNA invertase Pin-like site-specific DNA recombinase